MHIIESYTKMINFINWDRWVNSCSAKDIAFLYLVFGFIGGIMGTVLSMIIRMELSQPGFQLLAGNGSLYNLVITLHGLMMIFFFVMPVTLGFFGNWGVVSLLGAPDMSFARLNNISFWLAPFAMFLLIASSFVELGAGVGWTLTAPLSGLVGIPNVSMDLTIFALHVSGLSSLLASINFIATILNMRIMALHQVPLFVSAVFITSILLLLSLPVLACALTLLIFDRMFNTAFFDPVNGGDPVLWNHLFWFFGHGRRNNLYEIWSSIFKSNLAKQMASCKLDLWSGLVFLKVKVTWTVKFSPYENLFRLDPQYRIENCCKVVPFCKINTFSKKRKLGQEADHVRVRNTSLRQRLQGKCVLVNMLLFKGCSFFHRRYYTCQVNNNIYKIDVKRDKSMSTLDGQETRCLQMENLRDLELLKKEILSKSKSLTPFIVTAIKKKTWPMLNYAGEISELVTLRQRYLALLSSEYGIRAKQVEQQLTSWITKLDLRVWAIETVYRSNGNLIPGVDGQVLKRDNLLDQLNYLKFNALLLYKSSPIKRVNILTNRKENLFCISTIADRIVQTLFIQLIEPVIDVFADKKSFGFRQGRNAHQIIGHLSKSLHLKQNLPKEEQRSKKYIINIDAEQDLFFEAEHKKWLLNSYPFPSKFKFILEDWLNNEIQYQRMLELSTVNFPQGSIIGPSLINYSLNGLEKAALPHKVTACDEDKLNWYNQQGFQYSKGSSIVRKTIQSNVFRYAGKFIVVVNDEKAAVIIKDKIEQFLFQRGLKINPEKSCLFLWENNTRFEFLGFTFHNILRFNKRTIITTQKKAYKVKMRRGLYVYPSKNSIQKFKWQIKNSFILNMSPYKLINKLNPIIRKWGNYFSVGSQSFFSRLDHFIWYRCYRYIRKKFKKVSVPILVERFFKGVPSPAKRGWHFHAVWTQANSNVKKRRGKLIWILLLCKLNNPIPAHMLNPSVKLLNTSYYLDVQPFVQYNNDIIKLKSLKTNNNNWTVLYEKQNGICSICKNPLGYLTQSSLEIHHVKFVSSAKTKEELSQLNSIDNLQLLHKTCHKSTLRDV